MLKISNPKHQTPNKLQISMLENSKHVLALEVGAYLEFGI